MLNTKLIWIVSNFRIWLYLVRDFFVDGWLLLWCKNVFIGILDLKLLSKWYSDGSFVSSTMLFGERGKLKRSVVIRDYSLYSYNLQILWYQKGDRVYFYCSCIQWELVQHKTTVIVNVYRAVGVSNAHSKATVLCWLFLESLTCAWGWILTRPLSDVKCEDNKKPKATCDHFIDFTIIFLWSADIGDVLSQGVHWGEKCVVNK